MSRLMLLSSRFLPVTRLSLQNSSNEAGNVKICDAIMIFLSFVFGQKMWVSLWICCYLKFRVQLQISPKHNRGVESFNVPLWSHFLSPLKFLRSSFSSLSKRETFFPVPKNWSDVFVKDTHAGRAPSSTTCRTQYPSLCDDFTIEIKWNQKLYTIFQIISLQSLATGEEVKKVSFFLNHPENFFA